MRPWLCPARIWTILLDTGEWCAKVRGCKRLWKKSPRLHSRRKSARSTPGSMPSLGPPCTSTLIVFQPRTRTASTTSRIWREVFPRAANKREEKKKWGPAEGGGGTPERKKGGGGKRGESGGWRV